MPKHPAVPTLLETGNRLVAAWQSNLQPSMQDRHAFMAALTAYEQQQNELLEAIKGVVAVADRDTVEFRRARAAIAKAIARADDAEGA